MDDPNKNLGIIGTGLIGGSLGMAAIEAGYNVYCYNRKEEVSKNAVKSGVANSYFNNIEKISENCDFIILACHIDGYKNALEKLKDGVNENTIISDVGSVQTVAHEIALDVLKEKANCYIAAHPVAGKELSGLENADKELFKGKKLIITKNSIEHIDTEKQKFVKKFWESLGGNITELDCNLHDRIYARISHYPQFLSFKLSEFFPNSEVEGMKEFTRLMNSPKNMWGELFKYNFSNIKACNKDFIERYFLEIKDYKFTRSGEIDYPQIAHIIVDIYLKILDDSYIEYAGSGFKSFTSGFDENKKPIYNIISQPTKVKLEQIVKELENSNISGNL